MSFAKVALIGTAVTVGAAGTCLLVLGNGSMPACKTLSEISDYQTTYKDKIGSYYAYFLVASSEEGNEAGWKGSHKRWQSDVDSGSDKPASDEFKKERIGSAFDSSASEQVASAEIPPKKALNKACDDVYKKAKTDVAIEGDDTNKKNLMQDLWRYCSVLGNRPETIKEAKQSASESTIGKAKEAELIATTAGKNDRFWEIKGEWFKALNVSSTGSDYFGKNVGSGKGKKNLRGVCEDAYKGNSGDTSTDGTKPKQDEAIKYCSLDTATTTPVSK